jgi:hypothetical protein
MVLLRREAFDLTIVKPFLIFILFIFIGSFFSPGVDFYDQLSSLRSFILKNFLVPIMLWQVCKDKSDVNYFFRIIIACLLIMCLYGIFCSISGHNPYLATLSNLFDKQDNNIVFSQGERSSIIGKIQSTTSHPMLWSVILCMTLFSSYILFGVKKNVVFYTFIALVLINLLICNVRTGIVASILGMAFLFTHLSLRYKVLGIFLVILILAVGIDTSIFGKYQPFVESIVYFNDANKNIGGSSLDMRITQLGGAILLWKDGGIIFGNGFGWCENYYNLYGDHPILLGFESIIYIILIENGILGIIIYGFLFYNFFRMNYLVNKESENKNRLEFWLINSFIIAYIVFIIVTGFFGFNFFLIFLVLMFLKIISTDKNEKIIAAKS